MFLKFIYHIYIYMIDGAEGIVVKVPRDLHVDQENLDGFIDGCYSYSRIASLSSNNIESPHYKIIDYYAIREFVETHSTNDYSYEGRTSIRSALNAHNQ